MDRDSVLALAGTALLQLPIWGASMTFGILQQAYSQEANFNDPKATGVIGTTMNGVSYLAMPLLFTLLDGGGLTQHRRLLAYAGVVVACIAWVASSFATNVGQLIFLQGVLAAFGSTLLYSSSTMYLDDRFTTGRATAYGAILSSKNIVGTGGPVLIALLVEHLGVRWTLRIWGLVVLVTGIAGVLIIPNSPPTRRAPKPIHWSFLRHKTFYIYSLANIAFSSGYGLPQTYLPSYARDITQLPPLFSSLMLTFFNAPGIISCLGMGLLSDKFSFSSSTNVLIVGLGSSLFTMCLWGLGPAQSEGTLIAYSIGYGFFASAFSTTWGGWVKDFEKEADESDEVLNTGMLYGFFNGARGVGYLIGGLVGVELLEAGGVHSSKNLGYGTVYGAVILFTGLTSAIGALSAIQKGLSRVLRCGQAQNGTSSTAAQR